MAYSQINIIIENIESQRKKNTPGFNKPIISNNNSIKGNINNNIQNVINGFKRHISSNNSPKNRPENKEYMLQQKNNKINTHNVSLNTSLTKEPGLKNHNAKFSSNSNRKNSPGNKLNVNLKLDLNKIKKKDNSNDQSIENILNSSNCSLKSSLRESNYYKKEADKLSTYIKNCID